MGVVRAGRARAAPSPTCSPAGCCWDAALLAAQRRGGDRVAALLAATGLAWLAGSLVPAALYLHRGPLVHLLLAYPSGRAPRPSGAGGRRRGLPRRCDRAAGPRRGGHAPRSAPRSRRGGRRVPRARSGRGGGRAPSRPPGRSVAAVLGARRRRAARRWAARRRSWWRTSRARHDRRSACWPTCARPLVAGRRDRPRRRPRRAVGAGHAARPARARARRPLAQLGYWLGRAWLRG